MNGYNTATIIEMLKHIGRQTSWIRAVLTIAEPEAAKIVTQNELEFYEGIKPGQQEKKWN
jgi:hypothetical protein